MSFCICCICRSSKQDSDLFHWFSVLQTDVASGCGWGKDGSSSWIPRAWINGSSPDSPLSDKFQLSFKEEKLSLPSLLLLTKHCKWPLLKNRPIKATDAHSYNTTCCLAVQEPSYLAHFTPQLAHKRWTFFQSCLTTNRNSCKKSSDWSYCYYCLTFIAPAYQMGKMTSHLKTNHIYILLWYSEYKTVILVNPCLLWPSSMR